MNNSINNSNKLDNNIFDFSGYNSQNIGNETMKSFKKEESISFKNLFYIIKDSSDETIVAVDTKMLHKQYGSNFDIDTHINEGKIIPIHIDDQQPGKKLFTLHAPQAYVTSIKNYGITIQANGKTVTHQPHQLTIIALSPTQLLKINQTASNAFKSYAISTETNNLEGKIITPKFGPPLSIAKKIPQLGKLQQEATKRKNQKTQELRLEEEIRKDDQRRTEKRQEIKKKFIRSKEKNTYIDVKKSESHETNTKTDKAKQTAKEFGGTPLPPINSTGRKSV